MARAWPRALGAARPARLPSLATPNALEDGIDSIAVALGVGPALQDDHAHAFARKHAVGICRERPGSPRARQGIELAEYQREIDVGLEIDAAGDGQVGPAFNDRAEPRGPAPPATTRWRRRRQSWPR